MRFPWKPVLLAFVLGSLIGAAAAWGGHAWKEWRWEQQDPYERLLERFSSRLDLTAEQRTAVRDILEAKRQSITALREEVGPRFREIRTSTSQDIRNQLTPEQQQEFDIMQKEWDAGRKKRRHR